MGVLGLSRSSGTGLGVAIFLQGSTVSAEDEQSLLSLGGARISPVPFMDYFRALVVPGTINDSPCPL